MQMTPSCILLWVILIVYHAIIYSMYASFVLYPGKTLKISGKKVPSLMPIKPNFLLIHRHISNYLLLTVKQMLEPVPLMHFFLHVTLVCYVIHIWTLRDALLITSVLFASVSEILAQNRIFNRWYNRLSIFLFALDLIFQTLKNSYLLQCGLLCQKKKKREVFSTNLQI